jgi:hypothetical protein
VNGVLSPTHKALPRTAIWLGAAGLLPFLGLPVAVASTLTTRHSGPRYSPPTVWAFSASCSEPGGALPLFGATLPLL